ncbi:HV459 protein, partial [Alcedo cyanopectus]|nr:HV459 protein [Ceyx cyanopectus]
YWSDCCFFFLSAAVTGQVALEQHRREVSVREGDGVTFLCTMSGGSMNDYYMFWYRQMPHGTLQFIFRESNSYGEGFRDRFRASVERSNNRITL